MPRGPGKHLETRRKIVALLSGNPQGVSVTAISLKIKVKRRVVSDLLKKMGCVMLHRERKNGWGVYTLPENAGDHERKERKESGGSYNPTPEEIADRCEVIQRDWDDAEYQRRAGMRVGREWMPPQVSVPRELGIYESDVA